MRCGKMAPFVLLLCLILVPSCYSLPLCMDQSYPKKINSSLAFCGYSDKACCSAADDLVIQNQFTTMNISDAACADVMKSILCAQCNPYAFELYSKSKNYPVLCNNNLVNSSSPSNSTTDFCTETWNTCKDISIPNSPFGTSNGSPSKLSDSYKGASDFCSTAGGSATDQTVCFNGGMSVGFNGTQPAPPPQGICLERVANGTYYNFVPHPDGSNRVFLGTQSGKIFLATVPPQGSGKTLDFDLASPFIDLTDVVHYDNEFGLLGFAFHPNFLTNGRFFVSYNCDKSKSATCSGKCSCNSEINCDPSKLGSDNGALPCQYQEVIAEYTVNGSSASPSTAKTANPAEISRVFTMGLPYNNHHAGEIFFGPGDGYLYLMMGDGGNSGDPWNFAQNKKSMLGKALRLNVDIVPTNADIDNLTLWGNYSVPKDNPYFTDPTFRPEVYAYGFRNPWRCSYDAERPTYLFCGETSEDTYEEINLVTKGGNYGWRIYQGYDLYFPPWAPGPNISANSIDPIFPVNGYNRSEVNNNLGSAAIVSGYVYRGNTDPCLYGRFVFGDLYANDMFTSAETPRGSGNFSRDRITFTCSKNSPIRCDFTGKSSLPSLGYIFSFGQDNNRDLFYATIKGVYRVVRPSLCGYSCPLESNVPPSAPPPSPGQPSQSSLSLNLEMPVILVLTCLYVLLGFRF
ncbi:HIPL1 protein [Rhynchospora pubera]|uniref:HIPL1 protein n=1 Tax=Rhynchospora pubera TaxID=906938 RepID=A0AAV8D0J5_9POAL|nr:HIPL1 protein [Rhynchospora pubera]